MDMEQLRARFIDMKGRVVSCPAHTSFKEWLYRVIAREILKQYRQSRMVAAAEAQIAATDTPETQQTSITINAEKPEAGQIQGMEILNDKVEERIVNIEIEGVKVLMQISKGEALVVKKRKRNED